MITSLTDLRPGDLLFGPIGGAVGAMVGVGQLMLGEGFEVGSLSIKHVGVVVEGGRLVQAMPSGAEEIELSWRHWTPKHAYARLPVDYPGQNEDAAEIARAMIGTPYSFASYAALALWRAGLKAKRLERWIDRRKPGFEAWNIKDWNGPAQWLELPREAICSVLADQAWTLAGKRVMEGVPHQCVTPGALARRLLMMEDVQWGFPR